MKIPESIVLLANDVSNASCEVIADWCEESERMDLAIALRKGGMERWLALAVLTNNQKDAIFINGHTLFDVCTIIELRIEHTSPFDRFNTYCILKAHGALRSSNDWIFEHDFGGSPFQVCVLSWGRIIQFTATDTSLSRKDDFRHLFEVEIDLRGLITDIQADPRRLEADLSDGIITE